MHLLPEVVRETAEQMKSLSSLPLIAFHGPVCEDPALARDFLAFHRSCETSGSSLEHQTRITALIGHLLAHHAETRIVDPSSPGEPLAVGRARVYLDENLSDKVTLSALARFAGLPPFRLLRAFQKSLGLTPHAYQLQARVRAASRLLQGRDALAEVAAAIGFADQAHLTRVFKGIMGATPGQYRAAFSS